MTRKERVFWFLAIICLLPVLLAWSQTKVEVSKVTAAATGPVSAANSDSVTQCSGCTFAVNGTVAVSSGSSLIGSVAPWAGGTFKSGAITSAMTGTTSTSVIAGVGSNYLYITNCTASNGSTTVSTDILLQDGTGGTTLYVLPAPAAAVATTGGGGGTFTFPTPLKVPTVGNGLFAANVTTSSSTKLSCSGFASTTSY